MITYSRTNSAHPGFLLLVELLDKELAERYGSAQEFYSRFNTLQAIRHVVLVQDGEEAVACGAIKIFEPGAMEVKRMYTLPAYRSKGIAARVLQELEAWAAELGCKRCVLETGVHQPEAIRLYEKSGYSLIPNYGQYQNVSSSVCFQKQVLP